MRMRAGDDAEQFEQDIALRGVRPQEFARASSRHYKVYDRHALGML